MANRWTNLGVTLSDLDQLTIPRYVIRPNYQRLELHGFSDASEQAYCAAVYVRAIGDGWAESRLLTSKTKVAPVKAQSLPRLELCGLLLLANLISFLLSSLDLNCSIHCWTDSEITLRWISSSSGRWLPFVANRVSKIQELTPVEAWHFVPGKINPADCGTRGIPIEDLISNQLWWKGPEFLSEDGIPSFQFCDKQSTTELMEERKVKVLTAQHSFSVLRLHSCYLRLQRVTGCLLLYKLKSQRKPAPGLGSVELKQKARIKLIQLSQQEDFQPDIDFLETHGRVKQSSSLLSLSPFLDSEGSLRVGGRLQKSSLPDSAKHQLIIHGKSHFTKLLVKHYHFKYHNAGNRLLLALLRQDYWIVQGRDVIRSTCSRCLRCRLLRQKTANQLMGSLPSPRVTISLPFHHVGVDYAGPFTLQSIKGRGQKQFKGYFCIFICMSTKAVHVEFGTDLSTESFIGVLKRFISRRGYPLHLYSDCGSNFKGANREMVELVKSDLFNSKVSSFLSDSGCNWHFNSPSAPHQGGIWESAVRSVKFHLLRIIGNTTLTLEEFATVLCQTEAALKSRPLQPMSNNVDDLEVLTSGHFLIGKPLLSLPRPDVTGVNQNRLSRWQLQDKLFQSFWKVWSLEYLTSLQQRAKWTKRAENVKVGDLVAIKEDNLPPLKWRIGRITKTHPGQDGLVRVATANITTSEVIKKSGSSAALQTFKTTELQRPIVKLVPLISDEILNPN